MIEVYAFHFSSIYSISLLKFLIVNTFLILFICHAFWICFSMQKNFNLRGEKTQLNNIFSSSFALCLFYFLSIWFSSSMVLICVSCGDSFLNNSLIRKQKSTFIVSVFFFDIRCWSRSYNRYFNIIFWGCLFNV